MKSVGYRILAALCFFTRLPLWRIANVPREYYERVTPLWPLVGWLTGGVMVIVFYVASIFLPAIVALLLAIIARVMLTGALHEDGFADFCDGFGGGTTRERTLEIMKDSHIGTYGVLGLILYYIMLVAILMSAGSEDIFFHDYDIPFLLLCGDVFCKWASSTIVYFLPYARKAEEAKNKLVYQKVPAIEMVTSFVLGIAPIAFTGLTGMIMMLPCCIASMVCCAILFIFMKRRINGYTGDCCGATFIISELVFYFTFLIVTNNLDI